MAGRRVIERTGTLTPEIFAWLLRDLRIRAGYPTCASLARKLVVHPSLITKIESLERVPQRDFAERCDQVLATGGQLARVWDDVAWHVVAAHPDWFKRFAEMEARATRLQEYQPTLVSGLLQTEEYARALFREEDESADEESIAERVAARMSRQARYLGALGSAPLLDVVLDEAVIRREVGGPTVLYRQLAHLLVVAQRPNVLLQVAPLKLGARTRAATSLTLVDLPDGDQWIYSESADQGHFSADPKQLARRGRNYDRLRADALSPDESAQFIRRHMEGLLIMALEPHVLATASYFKSSYSGGNGGQCVEVAPNLPGVVPVRDSKDPSGPALVFPADAFAAFVQGIKAGDFGTV